MPRIKRVDNKQAEIKLQSVMDDFTEENNVSVEPMEFEKPIDSHVDEIKEEIAEVIEEAKQELSENKEEIEDTEIAVPGTSITKSQLTKFKKKYGKVFLSFYNDKAYVWHRLLRKDFTKICEETENIKDNDKLLEKREAEFCKICIIYPEAKEVEKDIEYEMTRVKMAQEILFRSGFYSPITQEL